MIGINYKDNFSRVFNYSGDVEAFVIPTNATMLHIWAIGAGGSGGNGFSRAAGSPGGGGGGGASGAIVTMLIPTRFLPPTLYILVGKGGGTNTDGYTKVMFRRGGVPGNVVIESLLLANTGNNGSTGAAGGAGGGGTILGYNLVNNAYAGLGTLTITVAQAGSNGGLHTGQAGLLNSAFSGGLPFTGGAGGAGCTTTDFTGGPIVPNANAQQQSGITLLGGGNVFGFYDGLNGLQFEEPFTCYGGSGGGSNNSGVGGKGGDGAIGCGGGGGGAGVTGGAGGRGGDGRVIITWF